MLVIKNQKAQYELAIMLLSGHSLAIKEFDKFYDVEIEDYKVPTYRGILTSVDEVSRQMHKFLGEQKDGFFEIEADKARLKMENLYQQCHPEYLPLEIR